MIGREYMVLIPWSDKDKRLTYGTDYNYGIGEPHYPVPALPNRSTGFYHYVHLGMMNASRRSLGSVELNSY